MFMSYLLYWTDNNYALQFALEHNNMRDLNYKRLT